MSKWTVEIHVLTSLWRWATKSHNWPTRRCSESNGVLHDWSRNNIIRSLLDEIQERNQCYMRGKVMWSWLCLCWPLRCSILLVQYFEPRQLDAHTNSQNASFCHAGDRSDEKILLNANDPPRTSIHKIQPWATYKVRADASLVWVAQYRNPTSLRTWWTNASRWQSWRRSNHDSNKLLCCTFYRTSEHRLSIDRFHHNRLRKRQAIASLLRCAVCEEYYGRSYRKPSVHQLQLIHEGKAQPGGIRYLGWWRGLRQRYWTYMGSIDLLCEYCASKDDEIGDWVRYSNNSMLRQASCFLWS